MHGAVSLHVTPCLGPKSIVCFHVQGCIPFPSLSPLLLVGRIVTDVYGASLPNCADTSAGLRSHGFQGLGTCQQTMRRRRQPRPRNRMLLPKLDWRGPIVP